MERFRQGAVVQLIPNGIRSRIDNLFVPGTTSHGSPPSSTLLFGDVRSMMTFRIRQHLLYFRPRTSMSHFNQL
jgi:hypothetical protein